MTTPTLVLLMLVCLVGSGAVAALIVLLKRAACDVFGATLNAIAEELR